MNRRLNELHLRRGRLLERIAIQRQALRREILPVSESLYSVDRLLARVNAVGNYVKSHPGLAVIAVSVLFFLRTRRILQWAKRGFLAWQALRAMRERLSMFVSRVHS